MDGRFRAGLSLVVGVALLGAATAVHGVLLESDLRTWLLAAFGAACAAWGGFALRADLGALVRARRGEIALFTLGVVAVLCALGYLSARYTWRFDLTDAGLHSLSEQTTTMLDRLDEPVHVVFFHDPLMAGSVDLYARIAERSDRVTVEFHDPTLNPARARMLGVQFAGTAVMTSEGRTLKVDGSSETDIANGILRVTRGATQQVCFLDGHGEADPTSIEAHDHVESSAGHSHGLGAQYVLHERHGLAKARGALETLGYETSKLLLVQDTGSLARCTSLVVAGPKIALRPEEVAAIRLWLGAGGNALFMLDPFVATGLEPVLAEYGVVLDDTIVIDAASHYWSDPSAPAVTSYGRHRVTRDLPLTFFPGARSMSPTPQRVPGTRVAPLVSSSTNSFGETTPDRAEFDPASDLRGPRTLMVIATRRPATSSDALAAELRDEAPPPGDAGHVTGRSRVAVIGDSDFATNSFFHFLGNGNLFLNAVSYLAAQENLIGIEPRTYDLPRISVTNRQIKATFVLTVLLVPSLLAMIGAAVWWRQR